MEQQLNNAFRMGRNKGLGFGLLLIVMGGLFLGFNLGFIPETLRPIVFSWQMLVVAIGLISIFKRHYFIGIVLLVIGKFFLVPKVVIAFPTLFPGLNANFATIYWPLLFVVAGVLISIQRIFFPNLGMHHWEKKWKYQVQSDEFSGHKKNKYRYSEYNPEGFSKNSIFGSGDHIVLDQEFKGGELNAVFGGISLDLRKTNLPEGETRLDINAVFGGITILIPSDWLVESDLDAVFGGFQDNRMTIEPSDKTRKLKIVGACVFGGGEIRN